MGILSLGQQPKRTTMKLAIILLVCVAVSLAQGQAGGNHGNHGHQPHNQLGAMIHNEVQALLAADSALTVDMCVTKCDALFDLVADTDETQTDKMCLKACTCEVNGTCQGAHTHRTTAAP